MERKKRIGADKKCEKVEWIPDGSGVICKNCGSRIGENNHFADGSKAPEKPKATVKKGAKKK